MPGFALLLPQRHVDVAQDDQRVRQTALPEGPAAYLPLAAAAGKRDVQHARRAPLETRGEADVLRGPPQQLLDRTAEQPFPGTIHQPQLVLIVEGEHRNVDLTHHRPQQCGCLERPQAFVAQRVGQRIDLEQRLAERIVAPRATRPKREIALSQRLEQIRHGLQRKHDAMAN
jgi:hypothetical protein